MDASQVTSFADNPGRNVEVEQEVLAQRPLRRQAELRDDLAQRRQGVNRAAQRVSLPQGVGVRAQSRTSI
jgi:hypothetical protein